MPMTTCPECSHRFEPPPTEVEILMQAVLTHIVGAMADRASLPPPDSTVSAMAHVVVEAMDSYVTGSGGLQVAMSHLLAHASNSEDALMALFTPEERMHLKNFAIKPLLMARRERVQASTPSNSGTGTEEVA